MIYGIMCGFTRRLLETSCQVYLVNANLNIRVRIHLATQESQTDKTYKCLLHFFYSTLIFKQHYVNSLHCNNVGIYKLKITKSLLTTLVEIKNVFYDITMKKKT